MLEEEEEEEEEKEEEDIFATNHLRMEEEGKTMATTTVMSTSSNGTATPTTKKKKSAATETDYLIDIENLKKERNALKRELAELGEDVEYHRMASEMSGQCNAAQQTVVHSDGHNPRLLDQNPAFTLASGLD